MSSKKLGALLCMVRLITLPLLCRWWCEKEGDKSRERTKSDVRLTATACPAHARVSIGSAQVCAPCRNASWSRGLDGQRHLLAAHARLGVIIKEVAVDAGLHEAGDPYDPVAVVILHDD